MRVGLAFRDLIPQPVLDALDHMWAAIAAGYHTEHHADDTHGDVHADSLSSSGDLTVDGDFLNGEESPLHGRHVTTLTPPDERNPIAHVNQLTITGGVGPALVDGPIALEVIDPANTGNLLAQQRVVITKEGNTTIRHSITVSQSAADAEPTAPLRIFSNAAATVAVDLNAAWNASGTAYRALDLAITDSAFAAGSLAINVTAGATTLFEVDPTGDIRFGDGTIRRPDDTGDAAVFGDGTTTFTADQHDFVDTDGTLRLRITDTLTLLSRTPLILGSAGGPRIAVGTGSPEGVVSALVGSLFLRQDGGTSTTLYVKESGIGVNGWVAK